MYNEPILEVVTRILQDKSNTFNKAELPSIICSLLQPHANIKTISNATVANINKLIQEQGICPQCRNGTLRYTTDLFCSHCKSVLKEKAKKAIH